MSIINEGLKLWDMLTSRQAEQIISDEMFEKIVSQLVPESPVMTEATLLRIKVAMLGLPGMSFASKQVSAELKAIRSEIISRRVDAAFRGKLA